jgi:thiamine-phosphate pyrophosphorylase
VTSGVRQDGPRWRPPQPLNAILDAEAAAAAGWDLLDLAHAFLAGGARFLQLRAKRLPGARLLATAEALARLVQDAGGVLIVNDRADVARLAGASGVHVGQMDLAPSLVRPIVGPDAIIGASTHSAAQVERMLAEPIDYLAIGPVFETHTKDTGCAAVGLEGVRAAAALAAAAHRPLVAIGGITCERAPRVLEAGAAAVAVIGALLTDGRPEARVREFLACG